MSIIEKNNSVLGESLLGSPKSSSKSSDKGSKIKKGINDSNSEYRVSVISGHEKQIQEFGQGAYSKLAADDTEVKEFS
jgi:hypothetical protein